MTTPKDFDIIEQFQKMVASTIDEDGILPLPGISIPNHGKTEIAAIMEPETAANWFWENICYKDAKECIFGLDIRTEENQGTEFADAMICVHWAEGMDGKSWDQSYRIGVINYQHEPRIVRPIDFDNEHWPDKMSAEIRGCRPRMRMKVNRVAPKTDPDANS